MMNRTWLMAGAATALLAAAACNPYPSNDVGPPVVVSVQATSGANTLTATVGEPSGAAWTITDTPAACTPATAADPAVSSATEPLFFVTFNKSMNPLSIQTAIDDCTPAGGWLTVTSTTPIPSTKRWYSCYTPNASIIGEGASAVIFLGDAPVAANPLACPAVAAVPPPDGFDSPAAPDVSPGTVTTFRFTGTVRDRGGNPLAIDVSAKTAPDAGAIDNFLVTGTTSSSLTFAWSPSACEASTTRYQILAGTEVVKTLPPGTTSVAINATDTAALTTTKAQSWSIHALTVTSGTTYDVNSKSVTLVAPGFAAPAAPTATFVAGADATSGAQKDEVDLQWNAVSLPGASVKYDVYRAAASDLPGHTGEPGVWARLSPANTAETTGTTPFKDKAVAGGTTYFYAVVPKKETTTAGTFDGRGAQSASVTVLTRPAQPGKPAFDAVADTTLDVTFARQAGVVSYEVFRAPDAAGAAGTYASVGTVAQPAATVDPVVFSDTGRTAATKYWYQVTATNATGTSVAGDGDVITTKALPTPAAPTFGTPTATSVAVSWATVAGATGYKLERSSADCAGDATTYSTLTTGSPTTFTDATVTTGKTFFYRVTAQLAGADASAAGPAASVTTP